MLQQTQVSTVIPYYLRFLERFPTITSLALAPIDDVLTHWAGLGYYARARNLHKTAIIISETYNAVFPTEINQLIELPGIGRSTAGAILSFASNQTHAILDGNVKRVLARHFEVEGWYGKASVFKELWLLSEQLTPSKNTAFYNQAMMDLGATICTRSKPKCLLCPVNSSCLANKNQSWKLFPTPKPKNKNPLKQGYLVLVNQDDGVYIEKRPPSGIWGGLWSLPEFSEETRAIQWLKESYQDLDISKVKIYNDELLHKFSHYDFMIHLIYATPTKPINVIADNQTKFISANQLESHAFPTPVKNLILKHGISRV